MPKLNNLKKLLQIQESIFIGEDVETPTTRGMPTAFKSRINPELSNEIEKRLNKTETILGLRKLQKIDDLIPLYLKADVLSTPNTSIDDKLRAIEDLNFRYGVYPDTKKAITGGYVNAKYDPTKKSKFKKFIGELNPIGDLKTLITSPREYFRGL